MASQFNPVMAVSLPRESRIATVFASVNLADSYALELPAGASTSPEQLARFIFSHQPAWIGSLVAVRDAIVSGFGLKTSGHLKSLGEMNKGSRVAFLKIYSATSTEIILGEDDKHLDFRLSVLYSGKPSLESGGRLTMSTVVHCHNRFGRLYLRLIAPFHRLVVQESLRRAARVGWPSVSPGAD
jgi:hypothetical protein